MRELAKRYGQNQPLSYAKEFTAGYMPTNLMSASTPMSLCLMDTCRLLVLVVRIVRSTSGRTCSRMPLSIACSTIWKTPYFTIMLPVMKPAPDETISEIKVSAPKTSVTTLLAPSTKGPPTTAKVVKSTASRYRTFGSVTGLLSPQGERVEGILTVEVTVATLERATRPTRVSPRNRFVLLDL